ncbi:hypothetical protein [Mesorhizobium argentiipisi]|uniref:Strictosidine synthase conserved region domain-containing protein n=1 Tax=Mesorhizobium argentiipisi TaxID=3015175 RepID=A0ABU8KCL7_9HYPH
MTLLDPVLDLFRGKAITVPPLDGAFRPNARLDEAGIVVELDAPDDLACTSGGQILVASGKQIFELDRLGHRATALVSFDETITALAAMPDGSVVVAFDDGRLRRWLGGNDSTVLDLPEIACPTALAVLDPSTVLVAQGSQSRRPSEWRRDFLERNSSGAVWAVELSKGRARRLADGLAFPNGIAPIDEGRHVLVSEAWCNRLVKIVLEGGSPQPILGDLPGYPSRLVHARDGGFWLALFAPRNRLIEFVLSEAKFRRKMMAEVAPELWVAPALSPPRTFMEPLQCGSVRTMGISKAWAPTRSYGLIVRLDKNLVPVASYHSRANGLRHGTTSVLDVGDGVLVTAKGANAVIEFEDALA